jgi:hypothetical protein
MIAIETRHAAEPSVTGIVARITTGLQALAAQALHRLSADSAQPAQWRSLDDRLLRDIGASPLDAQIARLHARMGAAETVELDAIGSQGQTVGQFMRRMKRAHHRDSF